MRAPRTKEPRIPVRRKRNIAISLQEILHRPTESVIATLIEIMHPKRSFSFPIRHASHPVMRIATGRPVPPVSLPARSEACGDEFLLGSGVWFLYIYSGTSLSIPEKIASGAV